LGLPEYPPGGRLSPAHHERLARESQGYLDQVRALVREATPGLPGLKRLYRELHDLEYFASQRSQTSWPSAGACLAKATLDNGLVDILGLARRLQDPDRRQRFCHDARGVLAALVDQISADAAALCRELRPDGAEVGHD